MEKEKYHDPTPFELATRESHQRRQEKEENKKEIERSIQVEEDINYYRYQNNKKKRLKDGRQVYRSKIYPKIPKRDNDIYIVTQGGID